MKNLFKILPVLLIVAGLVTYYSCSEEEAAELTLVSITAGVSDLNGATAPTDVVTDAIITATFSTDIDAATATAENVVLKRDYDDAILTPAITVSGSTITITPAEDFGNGTKYFVNFFTGLKSTGGKALASVLERSFTTEGNFVPAGAIAYWDFEDGASAVVGDFVPTAEENITYAASRNEDAGNAAVFNGTTSIIEYNNGDDLVNTSDFTLSFWVKALTKDVDGGHFVLGVAGYKGFQFEIGGDFGSCKLAAQYDLGDGSASEDLWFPANGNVDFAGWTYCQDLSGSGGLAAVMQDTWAHVVCVYNSTTKIGIMYINGVRRKEQDFNLFPAPKNGVTGLKYAGVEPETYPKLAFGWWQSREGTLGAADPWGNFSLPTANHFKGHLDDVRVFHIALTEEEIGLMYNSEK